MEGRWGVRTEGQGDSAWVESYCGRWGVGGGQGPAGQGPHRELGGGNEEGVVGSSRGPLEWETLGLG